MIKAVPPQTVFAKRFSMIRANHQVVVGHSLEQLADLTIQILKASALPTMTFGGIAVGERHVLPRTAFVNETMMGFSKIQEDETWAPRTIHGCARPVHLPPRGGVRTVVGSMKESVILEVRGQKMSGWQGWIKPVHRARPNRGITQT